MAKPTSKAVKRARRIKLLKIIPVDQDKYVAHVEVEAPVEPPPADFPFEEPVVIHDEEAPQPYTPPPVAGWFKKLFG
jgi:hypothetical protein